MIISEANATNVERFPYAVGFVDTNTGLVLDIAAREGPTVRLKVYGDGQMEWDAEEFFSHMHRMEEAWRAKQSS